MRILTTSVFTVCLGLGFWGAMGQSGAQKPSQPSTPPPASSAAAPVNTAKPGDVDTVEHIIAATYDVISGPAGPRDWDRFRSLFYPGARLIPSRHAPNGPSTATVLSPDDYVVRGQNAFSKDGFFENAVANRVEAWDNIAHVFSTYESHRVKGDKPFARGINSFQLFNDGTRWWVMTIYWESEDPAHPLPEKYLK